MTISEAPRQIEDANLYAAVETAAKAWDARDAARSIAARLLDEVAAVRELHKPQSMANGVQYCGACWQPMGWTVWPCPTARLVYITNADAVATECGAVVVHGQHEFIRGGLRGTCGGATPPSPSEMF